MVNLFGVDLGGAFDAIKGATSDLFQNLDLSGPQQAATGGRDPFAGLQLGGGDPFKGLSYGNSAFDNLSLGGDPFAGLGSMLGGNNPQTGYSALASFGYNPAFTAFDQANQKVAAKAQKDERDQQQAQINAIGSTVTGPATGMTAGVAKWASQAQQTFGDLLDPDIMLAIMTNESGGDPNAYNAAGNAWGLFQQVGLNSKDPSAQFAGARQLAQQKLASINQSYAAHGLNPDARTRARDFALAWAGHFDYDTGQPNPASRDSGSGQTADQLANIFLGNYDRIKAGRQAAPAGNVKISAQGFAFPVVGFAGPVQLHWGSETGGSDLMAPEGSPIVSMGAGTITDTSPNSLGGNTVTMKLDNGLIVYMAHLRDAPLVKPGQRVAAGTPLGYVGTTGNAAGGPAHLHIGVGYSLVNGSGPTGGLGTGFNAVDWMNEILRQTSQPTGGGGAGYR